MRHIFARVVRRRAGAVLLALAGSALLWAVAHASGKSLNLACDNNAYSLYVAVMEYTQDYDEHFPVMNNTATFQKVVAPYVHDPSIYNCPATGTAYTPNAALSGVTMAQINSDPRTVAVVSDSQRHADGHSTIAFLDGHVERGGVDQTSAEQTSVNNLRYLSLGLEQYVQDYDQRLPPMQTPAAAQKALVPYTGGSRYFQSPATHMPYVPNSALSYHSITEYSDPRSVETYRDARRHRDGQNLIAYLDGHVARQ